MLIPAPIACRLGCVLGRNEDGRHSRRSTGNIADRNLRLGVGTQPGVPTVLAVRGEPGREAVGEEDRQGHQFGRLVGGVTEHHPLIARPLLGPIDAARDLGRLTSEELLHEGGVGGEGGAGIGVADPADGLARDGGEIDRGARGDLAGEDDQVLLAEDLAGDAAGRILRQVCIEDRVGDRVADLVGMTLGDRFRGEDERIRHCCIGRGHAGPSHGGARGRDR
jgi:hypothetical protein